MKKYFLIFFMILGAGDFLYGILSGDQISVLVGSLIMILTIHIARRKKPEDDTKGPSPP
jgi:inner membrane protein involved in colicin E2 resistance